MEKISLTTLLSRSCLTGLFGDSALTAHIVLSFSYYYH